MDVERSPARTEKLDMKKLHQISGATLSETLISMSIAVVLIGIGIVGSIAIQRSFDASIRYANSQSEQVRVLDYMAMDLRRALSVSGGGTALRLTIPDYYDATGNPRTPTIVNGTATYGNAASVPVIRYFLEGSQFMREVNGAKTVIAENVQDFRFDFQDFNQVIEIAVTFVPTFRVNGNRDAARDGTRAVIRTLLRNRRQV